MDGLRLEPLRETKRYLVYNVDDKLVIRKRMLTMKRGTLVFVDETGKPVMKRSCGNPMATYIPPRGETLNAYAPPKPLEVEPEMPETLTEVVEPPNLIVETTTEPSTIVNNPERPLDLIPEGPPAPPILPIAAAFPPLWPLLGIPIVPALIPKRPNVNPVPEPTGMTALAIAGAGLAIRRRRKKS
jgi:hypothetical protein